MFCPNCGNEINKNVDFCPNCGNSILTVSESLDNTTKQNQSPPPSTSVQRLSLQTSRVIKQLGQKIKLWFGRYKKQVGISVGALALILIGIALYSQFWGFDSFRWNEKYKDFQLAYVTPTKIQLGIVFENKEKINDIKYTSTCGKVENHDLEIDWDLAGSTGKCKITANYKLRKISKEYTIVPAGIGEEELTLDYEIDPNSDEDLDFDRLTNKQEKEYKTSAVVADTDLDGLDDYYEIFTSKTDPNKKDSDGDGLSDYDELSLQLDPLKPDSKGDGVKDGQRTLTYEKKSDNVTVLITGTGNIASMVAEVSENTKISNKTGLIDKLYTFYTEGKLTEAVVTISYTQEELKKYELNEDDLSLYYYDAKESKYEEIETKIDKEKKTLTATLKHFSNYVVGDSSLIKEKSLTQILFVLDNSWSMYSEEQFEKITGNKYVGTPLGGFDPQGVRFQLTSNLVTRLSAKGYQMGLSEFRYDYANLIEIGDNVSDFQAKLKTMNGNFVTNQAGTNISKALSRGVLEFDQNSDNRYIVILTDGEDALLKNNLKNLITMATNKNVKICSVGFGDASDNAQLANLSNATGCKFYSSGNVDGLAELFENIGAELNDNLVDIDGDNEEDGILIADSGFTVQKDGFSFVNYSSNFAGGHCYGMAFFAQLYYKKQLPLKSDAITAKKYTSYAYDLSNTYFKNYPNLYDYKLKSNVLKYAFKFENFGETLPSDLRAVRDNKLLLNDSYKKEILNSGIYDITEIESPLSKEQQIQEWGFEFSKVENWNLNEDLMQTSKSIEDEEVQLFNAIYAAYINQFVTRSYTSGINFVWWAKDQLGLNTIEYSKAQGFLNTLKARLNDQDPAVISGDFSEGMHAINAISLVQDLENPNYYYIGVYDNNYPGEKRFIDLECKEYVCYTKANEYYKNSKQPIAINLSLEEDLKFYGS